MSRDLQGVDYVHVWVDGIHFSVRLGDDDRLCVLVMVGVRADGTKELVASTDGYRESTESWAELLRDCKRRPPFSSVAGGRVERSWLALDYSSVGTEFNSTGCS